MLLLILIRLTHFLLQISIVGNVTVTNYTTISFVEEDNINQRSPE